MKIFSDIFLLRWLRKGKNHVPLSNRIYSPKGMRTVIMHDGDVKSADRNITKYIFTDLIEPVVHEPLTTVLTYSSLRLL